jgi:nucleoside-diphosphate-sugar epimerase
MSQILITGIQGFTGRYLAPLLQQGGHELHGLAHHPALAAEASPGETKIHQCDLLDPTAVMRVIEEVQPDWVVHLAAIAFVAHGDVEEIYRTNILGTRNLLEAFSALKAGSGKILVASSANVYGNSTTELLDENVLPAPANDYAVSKLTTEYVARLYSSKLQTIVVRPFNYTGIGQSTQFLLPKMVDAFRRRAQQIQLGNIDVERDFSDVRDVVAAYSRLLDADVEGTFNVCSGRSVALREVMDMLAELSGHHMEISVNQQLVRANEVKRLHGDNTRLQQAIGPWSSRSIRQTLAWMLEGDLGGSAVSQA